MEFTVLTFLFSLLGFGVQVSNSAVPHNCDVEARHVNYEINDVPNNITLQIDGYEIAYPIKTEILGVASPQRAAGFPPQSLRGIPARYYILAEPILYRRAGDSEWKSLYEPEPLCPDYDFVVLKCKPPKETEK